MKKNIFCFVFTVLAVGLSGCSGTQETVKVFWGSSTKALEKARVDAVQQAFKCSDGQAFDAVLAFVDKQTKLGEEQLIKEQSVPDPNRQETAETEEETLKVSKLSALNVFLQDRRRNLIVLMGVPGAVNTTEVGVFFTGQDDGTTLVEVSSLSRRAKTTAAALVFAELSKSFTAVMPEQAPKVKP